MIDKEFTDKIIQEIEKSGFPLELDVVEKLRGDGILTFPNISFQDKNSLTHEIDILSIIFDETYPFKYGPTGIQLLVECKKSEKYPWVFFDEGYNPLSDAFGVGNKVDYSTDLLVLNGKVFNPLEGMFNTPLSGHHFNSFNFPKTRTHFEAFKKPNEQTTIYKAISSIFFGRKFLKDWFASTRKGGGMEGRTFLNHFAIVIDGPLLFASKDRNNFLINEVNHLLLLTFDTQENTHSGLLDNEIVIDVIKKEYVPDYIKLLKKDAEVFNKHLQELNL
jgi:hypothetical protein